MQHSVNVPQNVQLCKCITHMHSETILSKASIILANEFKVKMNQ